MLMQAVHRVFVVSVFNFVVNCIELGIFCEFVDVDVCTIECVILLVAGEVSSLPESMVDSIEIVVDGMADCVVFVVVVSLIDDVSTVVDSVVPGVVLVVDSVIDNSEVFVLFSVVDDTILEVPVECVVDGLVGVIRVVDGVVIVVIRVVDGMVLVVVRVVDGVEFVCVHVVNGV